MAKKSKERQKKPVNSKISKSKTTKEHKNERNNSSNALNTHYKIKTELSAKENLDLDIPPVPESPKRKEKLTLDTSKISVDVLKRMKKYESPDIKVVLANCERCGAVIPIPIPKKAVLDSELPVVPISYVHNNLENKDQHCLTIHLDHDFDIRRQRLSDVVISSD